MSLLPEDLMAIVIGKIYAEGSKNSIGSLRMVSKSWCAAVRECPLKSWCIVVKKSGDLKKLRDIMPKVTELHVSSQEPSVNVCPLSAMTGLTEVSISDYGSHPRPNNWPGMLVNLSKLPSSLQKLQLRRVNMQPNRFDMVKFINLKSLALHLGPSGLVQPPQIQKLLQRLGQLQVKIHSLPSEASN